MKPGQRGKVAGGSQRRERQDSVTRRVYIGALFRKARDSSDVHKESSVRRNVMIEGEVELTRLWLSISLGRRISGRGEFENRGYD
jgi:hypothetical protein